MRRPETVLAISVSIFFGTLIGWLARDDFERSSKNLQRSVERTTVLECMEEVGFEAADPSASRLEQLEQAQAWCERFLSEP